MNFIIFMFFVAVVFYVLFSINQAIQAAYQLKQAKAEAASVPATTTELPILAITEPLPVNEVAQIEMDVACNDAAEKLSIRIPLDNKYAKLVPNNENHTKVTWIDSHGKVLSERGILPFSVKDSADRLLGLA